VIDEAFAALFRFHDAPRPDSRGFVGHLAPKHGFTRVLLVSGDRETEVRRLAEAVAITQIHAGMSPEEKVAIVRRETERAKTLFIGDGINDAPALMVATVGIAFGQSQRRRPRLRLRQRPATKQQRNQPVRYISSGVVEDVLGGSYVPGHSHRLSRKKV